MSLLIGFNRIRQASERHRQLRAMVGKQIMLRVIEVDRRRRRLIFSQLAAIKEWRTARRSKLLKEIEEGQIRRGRIRTIVDFGLFVNLGGMDGLVHVSELSWGRIENPTEVYRPGQRIKVKVLNVDRERQRIALSIKALTPDPWDTVPDRYSIGSLVMGRITHVVDFGVFIELEPGVEGLLHNSELLNYEQREELHPSDSLLVKVFRIEPERRRIGLSVRQVQLEEWEEWVIAQTEVEEASAQVETEEVERTQAEMVTTVERSTEDSVAVDDEVEESKVETTEPSIQAAKVTAASEPETSVATAEEAKTEASVEISAEFSKF
jgi:small subunit ribosomal protein S1